MLVLVVGPSGAGKDTLLRGAQQALGDNPRFAFARRVITRPAQADAEDHDSLSVEAFAAALADGAFALSWGAHGLWYGVPIAAARQSEAGAVVVVNGSRAALGAALEKFPLARIVLIYATPAERAKRLASRGRESAGEIAARIARETPQIPEGAVVVDNSGDPELGIAQLVRVLEGFAQHTTPGGRTAEMRQ